MSKKVQSSREPLALQPPHFLQPPSLANNQASVRVTPIHSPTNHLHLRTIRSNISSPVSPPHNHPLLSKSPPKGAFYLLRGFAAVSYIHPLLKTPLDDPKTAKEPIFIDNEKATAKKIVLKKQKTDRKASSSSRQPSFFFQEDKNQRIAQKSNSKANIAWPVQTETNKTETSQMQIDNYTRNLVDSRETGNIKEEKMRMNETSDFSFTVQKNFENFLFKKTSTPEKKKDAGKRLSQTELYPQTNINEYYKITSPKEEYSMPSKVYWRNKDTNAHLMGHTFTKATRSHLNISQGSVRKETKSRDSHNRPDFAKKSQDSLIRPKTMSSDRRKIDIKLLEATQSQRLYGFSKNNNYDSPLSIVSPASQIESLLEKPSTTQQSTFSPNTTVSLKDVKSLKSLATILKKTDTKPQNNPLHKRKKSAIELGEKPRYSRISDQNPLLDDKGFPNRVNWPFMSRMSEGQLFRSMEVEEKQTSQIEDQDIVQSSIYKNSMRGAARLDVLPIEAEAVNRDIEKLNVRLWATSVIKNSKKIDIQEEIYEKFKSDKRRLNNLEVKMVKEEYDKKVKGTGAPDYNKIDKLVNGLKFFSTLNKFVRLKLLKNATFASYNAGETVFKQGEIGNLMYIIIKGAVNVKVTRLTPYNTIETVTVGVLYDGGYFGESPISAPAQGRRSAFQPRSQNHKFDAINLETGLDWKLEVKDNKGVVRREDPEPLRLVEILERLSNGDTSSNEKGKEKRGATIEVSESCDLLCIQIAEYQQICLNLIQKDVDRKLYVVQTLPFLGDLDRFALLPIANALVLRKYKYGEIILAAGEEVDRLRIVASGKCKLIMGKRRRVPFETPEQEKARSDLIVNFQTGLVDYTCKETATRESSQSALEKAKQRAMETWKNSYRSFNYDKLSFEDGYMLYLEHIALGIIAQGGSFGGRALLRKEDFLTNPELLEKARLSEPARISVVADTAEVEVYELSRENFESVPEFLGKIVKMGMKSMEEFDTFDVTEELNQIEEWDKYKNKELKELARVMNLNLIENLNIA